jgi:ornithine cyclodeaminase
LAQERGIGRDVQLVPSDGDPKDLFGRTRGSGAAARLRRVA